MQGEFVTLDRYQIGYADGIALARRIMAMEWGRQPRNGSPAEFKAGLAYDRVGARAELAGKLYLNPIKWNAFTAGRTRELPDLGDFIDVKGRSRAYFDLPVQKDSRPEWAYLLVDCSQHPVYRIVGWEWGHTAMATANWDDPAGGMPAFFVKQGVLRDPVELRREVGSRSELKDG
jgi:hypothetical protein